MLPLPYPLAWPEGWERTAGIMRKQSRYRMTMQSAAAQLLHQMDSWPSVVWLPSRTPNAKRRADRGRKAVVITSNLKGRTYPDGMPFASTKAVAPGADAGVAVWWLERGRYVPEENRFEDIMRVVACDSWRSVAGNMRACGVVIESLRAIERAEATEALKRAQWGFTELRLGTSAGEGAGASDAGKSGRAGAFVPPPWAQRLSLDPPYTDETVMRAWRACVAREHPDRGGDHEAFLELETARDEGLRWVRAQNRKAG